MSKPTRSTCIYALLLFFLQYTDIRSQVLQPSRVSVSAADTGFFPEIYRLLASHAQWSTPSPGPEDSLNFRFLTGKNLFNVYYSPENGYRGTVLHYIYRLPCSSAADTAELLLSSMSLPPASAENMYRIFDMLYRLRALDSAIATKELREEPPLFVLDYAWSETGIALPPYSIVEYNYYTRIRFNSKMRGINRLYMELRGIADAEPAAKASFSRFRAGLAAGCYYSDGKKLRIK